VVSKNLKGTKVFIKDDMAAEERQAEGKLRKKTREILEVEKTARCYLKGGLMLVKNNKGPTVYVNINCNINFYLCWYNLFKFILISVCLNL